jgi:hypothetical protein
MDSCIHRENTVMHGSLLSLGGDVTTKRFVPPSFAHCSTSMHADIRTTTLAQSSAFIDEMDDLPWDEREDDRLFWRGSPTGMWHSSHVGRSSEDWKGSQRIRLVNWTSADAPIDSIRSGSDESKVEYLVPPKNGISENEPVGEAKIVGRRKINRALMDVAFAGEPMQCEEDICAKMAKELAFTDRVEQGRRGAGRYKYLLDIDGNGWSSRFRRLMSQDAVVFKSTIYPEWWLDRVEPWVHYVPVKMDFEDIYDVLVCSTLSSMANPQLNL